MPIFYEPWYLDLCCFDGEWDVIINEVKKELIAALPYYWKKKGPFRIVGMPRLIKYMGPLIGQNDLSRAEQIIPELLKCLPNSLAYNISGGYDCLGKNSFVENGFSVEEKYSYRLTSEPADILYNNLFRSYRNQIIPRAEEALTVTEAGTIADFIEVHKKTFIDKGIPYPFTDAELEKYIRSIQEMGRGKMFFCKDKHQNIHAVLFLIWDQDSAYSVLIGNDRQLAFDSGASIYILWKTILFTFQELNLSYYDFMGSMINGVERVRINFGAEKINYLHAKKTTAMYRFIKRLI